MDAQPEGDQTNVSLESCQRHSGIVVRRGILCNVRCTAWSECGIAPGTSSRFCLPRLVSPNTVKGVAFPDLSGKTIVVIGGTTGLGLSAARAFVENGGRVVMVGRNPTNAKAAQKELGKKALALPADAIAPATAPRAIEMAVREFGGFDGLYHVAGGSGRKMGDGPLHEMTDEGWRSTLDLNLTSLVCSNRAAVRQFLAQGSGGSILNMGSVLGWSPSPRHFATHAYAAAKSAVIGFTKSIAAYYAGKDIRCNVLAPALVETPMSERAAQDETIQRFIKTKQPLDGGRIGQPSDLDAAAVYFMSDASRFTTGQVLAVDGGWCVSEGQFEPQANE
jgi:NAD(P)-dependent dehydrogenase (short-subunit alcohol dehydrogenase family)